MGLEQDEDVLVLRYQGCILAISDNFIPKSMPKLSIFSKKGYHFSSKNGQNQGLIFVQFSGRFQSCPGTKRADLCNF